MPSALEGHRRYLAALRNACAGHPDAHVHQLAALDRELMIAAGAEDSGYSGAVSELARAAWLDRAMNHARVAAAVGDPWSARAAALDYVATVDAADGEGWIAGVAAASAPAQELRRRSADAGSAFRTLLHALLRLHGAASEAERVELDTQARHSYAALRDADPAFAWSRIDDLPRYLWRTPWTGEARETVGRWIADLGGADEALADEQPDDPVAEIEAARERWRSQLEGREPVSVEVAAVDEVVAPYRTLAETLHGDDRASVAIRGAAQALVTVGATASTGPDALARFVEDGLLVRLAAAPLLARAEEARERQAVWPDPLVAHHWTTLADRLAGARSETEVDVVSVHAEACLAVEADWNGLLLATLLAPLRAACTYGWEGGAGSRASVERAAAATHALVGAGPRALLGVPRVAEFVDRILVPLGSGTPDLAAALEAEAGFDLLAEAQAWVLTAAVEQPLDRALRGLFDRAQVSEPAPAANPVRLWGVVVDLDDLVPALARPSRPSIPGYEAVEASGTGL